MTQHTLRDQIAEAIRRGIAEYPLAEDDPRDEFELAADRVLEQVLNRFRETTVRDTKDQFSQAIQQRIRQLSLIDPSLRMHEYAHNGFLSGLKATRDMLDDTVAKIIDPDQQL